MDKQIVVYPYNGTLLINKKEKERTIYKQNDVNEFLKYYFEQQKSSTKACILFDPIYNSGDRKQSGGCLEPDRAQGGSFCNALRGHICSNGNCINCISTSINLALWHLPYTEILLYVVLGDLIWVISNANRPIQNLHPLSSNS